MPKPIAVWNPARGVWEVPETENLICEHSDVFSETWPSSGTTRNGWAYGLPTWALRTDGSESSSLLPTPTVQDGSNTAGPSQLDQNSLPLNTVVTLLPTPAVNDMGEGKTVEKWDAWTAVQKAKHGNGNGHGPSLAIEALRIGEPTHPLSAVGSAPSAE